MTNKNLSFIQKQYLTHIYFSYLNPSTKYIVNILIIIFPIISQQFIIHFLCPSLNSHSNSHYYISYQHFFIHLSF
jgi:hypothetical protein